MSNSEFATASGSDTSFAPKKSHRQPTCGNDHYLRSKSTMSSEGSEAPCSPTPSSASALGNADVMSLLQMLTAQSARQEEARLKHEVTMAKFQASLLQAQTDSAKESAATTVKSRQQEAEEAEAARHLDMEAAERVRIKEADLRVAHMKEMEEKQATALRAKEAADKQAKVEVAIRHVKQDTPKMLTKDFPPTYMVSFKRIAQNQAIPQEEWASCFLFCLTGGDYTIWATLLDSAPDTSYRALKPQFLSRVGHDWSTNATYVAFKKKPFSLSYE